MSRDKLWPLQSPGRKNQRRSQAAWHWRSKYSFLHLKKTYLWNALKAFFPFPGNVHRKILTDISYQQIYAPNLECKGVATASHNAIKPGRSCQKLSNNIVQSMQMNANHIQASWIIMVLDTQISSNIYIYIYIYILYIHNFILIFLFSNDWLLSPAKLVQVNTSAKKSPCHSSAKMGHRLCRTNLAVTGFPCELQHH